MKREGRTSAGCPLGSIRARFAMWWLVYLHSQSLAYPLWWNVKLPDDKKTWVETPQGCVEVFQALQQKPESSPSGWSSAKLSFLKILAKGRSSPSAKLSFLQIFAESKRVSCLNDMTWQTTFDLLPTKRIGCRWWGFYIRGGDLETPPLFGQKHKAHTTDFLSKVLLTLQFIETKSRLLNPLPLVSRGQVSCETWLPSRF